MKRKLTLTVLTLFCFGTYFSQNSDLKGEWKGTINYDKYHMKKGDFNIDFDKGMTFTEWADGELHPCEFKANVETNGKIKLMEYETEEINERYICYFVGDLKYKTRGNKEILKGEFTSVYEDGSPCDIQGKMNLVKEVIEVVSPEENIEIDIDEDLNTKDMVSMKADPEMEVETNYLEKNQINCYPNPTQGFIRLDLSSVTAENAAVEIYSIDGRLKLNRQFTKSPSSFDLDLSSYENGIYLVKVLTGENEYTSRVVLNK
ncbi:MAG: T9SS type A sorting domain-containing protein [Flavobacteriales bacterium]|nr:T9SS type A sorting domain-containing protein [Flavobacteriales bacterium]